ncbi:MAG: DUF3769 domain-containing protein [Synechococcaceae cyanobacterium SM2_3_2]|nr:DUF3769 domain-containing protein [Synechococcaceae cyanobacterium SM2_3_2]
MLASVVLNGSSGVGDPVWGQESGVLPEDVLSPQVQRSESFQPAVPGSPLRLRSDRQSFDQQTEVFEAEGNVEMTIGQSRLRADQMRVEIRTQRVVAEGSIIIQLGLQEVRGQRLAYDFLAETGTLEEVVGLIDIANLPADLTRSTLPTDPITRSASPDTREGSRLIRFQADRIQFDAQQWRGENVRITNDLFDPPELQIRSPVVVANFQPDGTGSVTAQAGQLVFDQLLFLPLPISIRIDQQERQAPVSVYFDNFDRESDRRGLIVQPNFELLDQPTISFVVSPQLYAQRLFQDRPITEAFGIQTRLNLFYDNGQATTLLAELRGLDFSDLADQLRVEVAHVIPTGDGGRVTYSYDHRQRYFSGLLGFQILQNRLGASYESPVIGLGDSGIDLSYRLAADLIDGLGQDPIDTEAAQAEQTSDQQLQLIRLQLGTALSRSFRLWQPEDPVPIPLMETATGEMAPRLRFSSTPIEEGVWLNTGLLSSQAYYSNGETQSYLAGSVGVDAVLGQFLSNTLDYTNLSVTYSNGFLAGASPFLFDRITTREQLDLGILQQIYGPVRAGAETTIDLQSGRRVDTTFSLGYDRRTYGFSIQYNPVRETGAVELRVDGFNWGEGSSGERDVRQGLER